MEKKYDFEQISQSWRFCFNGDCPMRGECLRFQTGLEIPEDRQWGQTIFSTALKDGRCDYFRKDEKVTLATGFCIANNPSMSDAFVRMRHILKSYLGGHGTYYLYRNGKKWLSSQQQEDIRRLFRKAGYKEEVVFGTTKETYDFT